MKYCPRCGHPNNATAKFCAACGQQLTNMATTDVPAVTTTALGSFAGYLMTGWWA